MEENKEKKETKTKYLEARLRANKKYYEKNKEKMKALKSFHSAKSFIKQSEDVERLKELVELATDKLKELGY